MRRSKVLHIQLKTGFIETRMDTFMENIDSTFKDQGIDVTSCVQKAICSYVKSAIHNNNAGRGSGINKIIDGLVHTDYLMSFIEGTAVRNAIDTGGSIRGDCVKKYTYCQLSQDEIFDKLINYFNFY